LPHCLKASPILFALYFLRIRSALILLGELWLYLPYFYTI
jgi:hypothetical protein